MCETCVNMRSIHVPAFSCAIYCE